MGWSQQNANEFPDVYTTRTIQPGDINTTHLAFNILMATGTKFLLKRHVLHFIQRYLL